MKPISPRKRVRQGGCSFAEARRSYAAGAPTLPNGAIDLPSPDSKIVSPGFMKRFSPLVRKSYPVVGRQVEPQDLSGLIRGRCDAGRAKPRLLQCAAGAARPELTMSAFGFLRT